MERWLILGRYFRFVTTLIKEECKLCSPNIFSLFSNSNFATLFAHLFANGTKLKIHSEIKPLLICKLRMQKNIFAQIK